MCDNPSQELSNGFCYDKCPSGWQAFGGMCLKSCPPGFVDHGTTCEPSSLLRKPINAYMSPCPDGQIDRNGNCFEPQTTTFVMVNGIQVPRVTGCNCIKKTMAQRLQCTSGYVPFNNGCISKCPGGYTDIKDSTGEIASMYCQALCPLKTNSKNVRWPHLNGQCVKEYRSRTTQVPGALIFSGTGFSRNSAPKLGKPVTVASELAKKPLGSSLNDRYRAAQSIYKDLGSSPLTNPVQNAFGDSWISLLADPSKLVLFVIIMSVILLGGPQIIPLISSAFGNVAKGLGIASEKIIAGVGTGVGAVAGSTLTSAAALESSLGKNVAAAVANPAAILRANQAAYEDTAVSNAQAQGIINVATANAAAQQISADAQAAAQNLTQGPQGPQGPPGGPRVQFAEG